MKKPGPIIPPRSGGGDVYSLVESMTSAEKAALRKSWAKPASIKRSLHHFLFELIASGEVKSDLAAQTALKLRGGAQFSNLKQHLTREVTELLVSIHQNASPTMKLHAGLMQLQLLVERSQTSLARRLSKKLWDMAVESGDYSCTLEILHHRERLMEYRSLRQYTAEAEEIAALIERYTVYQHTAQRIQRHNDHLLLLRAEDQLRASEEPKRAIEKVKSQLLGLETYSDATPFLKLQYLAALATASYMLQEFEACQANCINACQLLEAHAFLIRAVPHTFLDIANITFYNEFALGNAPRVAGLLHFFQQLGGHALTSDYAKHRWSIIQFNTRLKIAHKLADYETVASIIDKESQMILGFAARVLPPSEELSIIASIVISLFVLERFKEADALLHEVKERNRALERQDIFYFTLVFHLAVLYEMKDWYRLDAATEAAYHVLYNRKKLRPFEKELMSFLKALPLRRGRGDTATFIKAFIERLEDYRADPVKRLYFLYFNYYDWLQSKLVGVSYREYKLEMLRKQGTGTG